MIRELTAREKRLLKEVKKSLAIKDYKKLGKVAIKLRALNFYNK
jgi:hypothetical protein